MNTISSTGSQVQQGYLAAHAQTETSARCTRGTRLPVNYTGGSERFVTLLSIGAIMSVAFCICLTNLDAHPVLPHATQDFGQVQTKAPTSDSGLIAVNNLKATQSQPSHSEAATRPTQASALTGIDVVPGSSAWPMVGLGFLLLLARGRVFSSAA